MRRRNTKEIAKHFALHTTTHKKRRITVVIVYNMGVLAYFVYIKSSCIIFSAKLFQNSQYIYYSQKNQQSTHICLDVSTCFGLGILAHFGPKGQTRKIN